MSIPMHDDEEIVLDLHPHWIALLRPALIFILVCGLATYGAVALPDDSTAADIGRWAILAVAVIIVVWWVVIPYLRWLTTRYVLTTDRLVIRSGIIARQGRDVPLNRVNDVSFSETLLERMLRSGTLVVESAGERGQITLAQVPRVEHVQREIYKQVDLQDEPRERDDEPVTEQ